ncbi:MULTISPECIES: phage portal protein family protein [Sorangium]|uniref:phage portal protein family protein n=1 Tax=Sorangium TaxID=39643 RepID=UPI003D9C3B98
MGYLGTAIQEAARVIGERLSPPQAAAPVRGRARRSKFNRRARHPESITRWLHSDVEKAIRNADSGDLYLAAQLYRSLGHDSVINGLLATRTSGLVRLPRRFRGLSQVTAELEARDDARPMSLFDRVFPPAELARLAADQTVLGVGVGEFLEVPWRPEPVLTRLDPQWLRYRRSESAFYYQTMNGLERVDPGDGRWFLNIGARQDPWADGLVWPLAERWISKHHAWLSRENWNGKLANPARAAVAPQGATDGQRLGFLDKVIAWGLNTVFELPPGWDVRLIESNGQGYQGFTATINEANEEFMIALAGSKVLVDGGAGFSNADIHATIRADLIQATADTLTTNLNVQGLSVVIPELAQVYGWPADAAAAVEYDTRPPANIKAEADALSAAAKAIEDVVRALKDSKVEPDVEELARRFAVPVRVVRQSVAAAAVPVALPSRRAPALLEAA